MIFEELLDKSLREVLEDYVAVYNLECGYCYGVASADDIESIIGENKVEEYEEAFCIEPLIGYDVVASMNDELLSKDKMNRICNNLGIDKR